MLSLGLFGHPTLVFALATFFLFSFKLLNRVVFVVPLAVEFGKPQQHKDRIKRLPALLAVDSVRLRVHFEAVMLTLRGWFDFDDITVITGFELDEVVRLF